MSKSLTTEKFIKKARLVHGNKYDYSLVEYIRRIDKIKLICNIHGIFEQIASYHLQGHGCSKCGNKSRNKITHNEFLKRAYYIYGNIHEYPHYYIDSKTPLKIICKLHGPFTQKPSEYYKYSGCKYCNNKNYSLNTEEFIKKARLVHGERYDYSNVKYVNNRTKVIIICKEHGDFFQESNSHLQGHGCAKCGVKQISYKSRLSSKKFIKKARLVHGDRYDYSKVNYINAKTSVIIICPIHGDFEQTAEVHYTGSGCNICSKSNYSQKAITWLNQTAKEQNIYIQHAENECEYKIPGTNYKADGYCKETNTIYEFYGDTWHGNLNLFEEQDQCHPFTDESAGSLYMKTMNREQEIKDLGYNLITIWENDYKKCKNNK